MTEIGSDGSRFSLLDSSGLVHRLSMHVAAGGNLRINGYAIPSADAEDLLKAIQNYLRCGFFDGRVRT